MTLHSVVIQKLLATNAHLGRRAAAHHFKLYTYGLRNGMTIIDSEKTLICLRNACHFIGALAAQNGRFMFVNTNPLFDEIVDQMTQRIGPFSPYSSAVWRKGGFLTNSSSPKRFRSRKKRIVFAPSQPPDCIVIMDSERKSSVILEADRLQIPVVALVDPSMPLDCYKRIAYPVPANDSAQFVYLFCNMITKTILLEQKRLQIASSAAVEDEEDSDEEDQETKVADEVDKEVDFIPYESLLPFPDDILEIQEVLDKLAVVNYSDVSGSSMGLSGQKSAIEVCNGLTFLDLLICQIESLNSKYKCSIPLLLMNTCEDTLKVLEEHSKSNIDIRTVPQSQDSLQEPNGELSDQEDIRTAPQSQDSQQEPDGELSDQVDLLPSGYEEVILSLINSRTVDQLLSQDKEYALLVSSDNVASTIDPKIFNHMVQKKIAACIECMETVQDPAQPATKKTKLTNTRSMWVDLKAFKKLVETAKARREGEPVPEDESDSEVVDDAVGIKIPPSQFVNVPQSRFVPMNTTSDLLILQSDIYTTIEGSLVRNEARTNPLNPQIHLGSEFEKLTDFQSRFKSIPSLIELDSLEVIGDICFGADVILKGRVSIVAKPGERLEIPDGTILENKEIRGSEDI